MGGSPILPDRSMSQYTRNPPLDISDLHHDPLTQFQSWLQAAREIGQIEPGAFVLSTADADGRPSGRVVLFKGIHQGALCFYTDYRGRKAAELDANPRGAATFWWDRLERQVRFEGVVTRLPRAVSAAYFATRPRGSQLGAHTSHQSHVVVDRASLDARLIETEQQFKDVEVPLPEHWGGYGLQPSVVEFWAGRGSRFHDRLRYRHQGEGWQIDRLEP